MLEQGTIVLIPIPFTDLSSAKRRPVIVISSNDYNQTSQDMTVVAMTSNPTLATYSFTITNQDLADGTLNRPGQVRVDKIYTLSQTLLARVFGKVKVDVVNRIQVLLMKVTNTE